MNLYGGMAVLVLFLAVMEVLWITQISVKRDYNREWKEYKRWMESQVVQFRKSWPTLPTWFGTIWEKSLQKSRVHYNDHEKVRSIINYLVLHVSEGLFPWYKGRSVFQWFDLYILADSLFSADLLFGPDAAVYINTKLSILESLVIILTAYIMRKLLDLLLPRPRGLPSQESNRTGWQKVRRFLLVVISFSLAYATSWKVNWIVLFIAPFIRVSFLEFLPATFIAIIQMNMFQYAELQVIDSIGYAAYRKLWDWIILRILYWLVIPSNILYLIFWR